MVNLAIVLGRVGKDLEEPRYTSGGGAVVNLSIATSERWKDKDGSKQQRTTWHKVIVWGNQAVACKNYLKKGSLVYIEGKLQTREYEGKDGVKKYSTEISATDVKFLNQKEEPQTAPAPEVPHEADLPF